MNISEKARYLIGEAIMRRHEIAIWQMKDWLSVLMRG
jgi:hypothetical protein